MSPDIVSAVGYSGTYRTGTGRRVRHEKRISVVS